MRGFLVLLLALTVMPAHAAEDLNATLRKLDAAALKFHSAEADVVWDNVQTEPIFDKDTQLGQALFERKSGQLSVALHIRSDNGHAYAKDVTYHNGALSLYEPSQKRMNIYHAGKSHAEFETLLTLGFGASGQDLEKGWQIELGGTETMEKTAVVRLVLTPREEALKKNVAKVELWIDPERGVALRQKFYSPDGNYRDVMYKNLRVNGSVAANAFEIKTAAGTVVETH